MTICMSAGGRGEPFGVLAPAGQPIRRFRCFKFDSYQR